MKILYFIDYPVDLLGGAQLSAHTICSELAKKYPNVQPVLVAAKNMHSDTKTDYKLIQYDMNEVNSFFLKAKFYNTIIKQENPDIVHSQMPYSAMVVCFIKKFLSKKNWVHIFTDRSLFDGYSSKSKLFFKFFSKQINYLVCTTARNAKSWETVFPSDMINVINNTVTPEFLDSTKSYNSIDDTCFTIGFAGRITEIKNWPLAIDVCKALKARNVDFKVRCAMTAFTDVEKQIMHQYISELQEVVGYDSVIAEIDIAQSKMPAFYSAVDVFVLTSTFESFGKTAIEAMVCNCAVIATNVGGLPEVIGKDENLYELNDCEKCADRIQFYASNPHALAEDKRFFVKRFNEKYSIKKNVDLHMSLYDQSINW